MNIVVAGGTGFVGREVVAACCAGGDRVAVLARRPGEAAAQLPAGARVEGWDGQTPGPWSDVLDGADAVINLTGEPVAGKRWSAERKAAILKSRVDTTRALVAGIRRCARPPRALINASAVGYYGSVPEGEVREDHPPGTGFLPETCVQWEAEAHAAGSAGVRVVAARIGIVLGHGGALESMMTPFRFFAGGHPGSGKQWFPWIHVADLAAALRFLAGAETVRGPVNMTAPAPVTMAEFCRTLGRVMGRPSWVPVPAFALRMGMGEMANMILTGQKVVPARLLDAGFRFRFADAETALMNLLRRAGRTVPEAENMSRPVP
jgi:hypothetical protein